MGLKTTVINNRTAETLTNSTISAPKGIVNNPKKPKYADQRRYGINKIQPGIYFSNDGGTGFGSIKNRFIKEINRINKVISKYEFFKNTYSYKTNLNKTSPYGYIVLYETSKDEWKGLAGKDKRFIGTFNGVLGINKKILSRYYTLNEIKDRGSKIFMVNGFFSYLVYGRTEVSDSKQGTMNKSNSPWQYAVSDTYTPGLSHQVEWKNVTYNGLCGKSTTPSICIGFGYNTTKNKNLQVGYINRGNKHILKNFGSNFGRWPTYGEDYKLFDDSFFSVKTQRIYARVITTKNVSNTDRYTISEFTTNKPRFYSTQRNKNKSEIQKYQEKHMTTSSPYINSGNIENSRFNSRYSYAKVGLYDDEVWKFNSNPSNEGGFGVFKLIVDFQDMGFFGSMDYYNNVINDVGGSSGGNLYKTNTPQELIDFMAGKTIYNQDAYRTPNPKSSSWSTPVIYLRPPTFFNSSFNNKLPHVVPPLNKVSQLKWNGSYLRSGYYLFSPGRGSKVSYSNPDFVFGSSNIGEGLSQIPTLKDYLFSIGQNHADYREIEGREGVFFFGEKTRKVKGKVVKVQINKADEQRKNYKKNKYTFTREYTRFSPPKEIDMGPLGTATVNNTKDLYKCKIRYDFFLRMLYYFGTFAYQLEGRGDSFNPSSKHGGWFHPNYKYKTDFKQGSCPRYISNIAEVMVDATWWYDDVNDYFIPNRYDMALNKENFQVKPDGNRNKSFKTDQKQTIKYL